MSKETMRADLTVLFTETDAQRFFADRSDRLHAIDAFIEENPDREYRGQDDLLNQFFDWHDGWQKKDCAQHVPKPVCKDV